MEYMLNREFLKKEGEAKAGNGPKFDLDAELDRKIQEGIKQGLLPVPQHMLILMRLYVQYTSPYYLSFSQNGKEMSSLNNYSFNHVAILENQLRYPVPLTSQMRDYYQKYLLFY
jgi:hypothetical protein